MKNPSPTDVWIKQLGHHRGRPRLFLDAAQAVRAGFAPGEAFEVEVDGVRVVLTRRRDGSRTVSSRRRGNAVLPVIDINSEEVLGMFRGMDAVRVVVGEDCVYILPLASQIHQKERLDRLQTKVKAGQPLAVGAIAHGAGILAAAIHQGFARAGVRCELAFANEIREDLLAHARESNDAWQPQTSALGLPMQELVQDEWLMQRLPRLEVLELGGLPCSGASKAGKARNGNALMEQHPDVGHLVFAALQIVNRTQPAAILLENVVDYAHSASAHILRNQLRDMGYALHEAVLNGRDFGALEDRTRWCLVAVTRGVRFTFDELQPPVTVVRTLAEILEDVPEDHPSWRTAEHLVHKRQRDAAKGSNFKMQFMSPTDTRVSVLRKGYTKAGSTDPRLRHPSDPARSRLLTTRENALAKGVPPALVEGLAPSVAAQALGQGIVYEPFRATAQRLAQSLLALAPSEVGDQDGAPEDRPRLRAVG